MIIATHTHIHTTMRAFLIGLLCLFLWTTVARYIYVTKLRPCQPVVAPVAPIESNRLTTLHLLDGNSPILEGYEQFAFDNNSTIPNISDDNTRYLDGVAAYLENNPDKNLEILGYYRPSEAELHEGRFENLGLARANKLMELLAERGVAPDRVFTDYKVGDEELLRPADFKIFSNGPDTYGNEDERLSRASYSFDNMVFSDANFESSSATFTPSQAFLYWADSVKVFLAANPEKALTIIGHTDKTGPTQYNQNLGLERAQAAKQFFESNGVAADIRINSMGEKQPIATNKSKEGRQRNRRVNFIIK